MGKSKSSMAEIEKELGEHLVKTKYGHPEISDTLLHEVRSLQASIIAKQLYATIPARLSLSLILAINSNGPVLDSIQSEFLKFFDGRNSSENLLLSLNGTAARYVNAVSEKWDRWTWKLSYAEDVARRLGLVDKCDHISFGSVKSCQFSAKGLLADTNLKVFVTCISSEISIENQIEDLEGADKVSGLAILVFALLGDFSQLRRRLLTRNHIRIMATISQEDIIACSMHQRSMLTLSQFVSSQLPLKVLSPYRDVGAAENTFVGRNEELQTVLRSYNQHFCITGPRRIGKTSLLRRLQSAINIEKLVPGTVAVLVDATVIRRLRQIRKAIWDGVSKVLEERGIESGTPDSDDDDLSSLSLEFGKWRKNGLTVLLLIDEIDSLLENREESIAFEAFLRTIGNSRSGRFVLCGYTTLAERVRDRRSSLFNLLETVVLGPVSKPAAVDLVNTPMASLGLKVEPGVADRLTNACSFIPWLIQAVCNRLLQSQEIEQSRRLTLSAFEDVFSSAEVTALLLESVKDPSLKLLPKIVLNCIAFLGPGSVSEDRIVDEIQRRASHVRYSDIMASISILTETYMLRETMTGFCYYVDATCDRLRSNESNLTTKINRLLGDLRR